MATSFQLPPFKVEAESVLNQFTKLRDVLPPFTLTQLGLNHLVRLLAKVPLNIRSRITPEALWHHLTPDMQDDAIWMDLQLCDVVPIIMIILIG